jgi:hypothetical protein
MPLYMVAGANGETSRVTTLGSPLPVEMNFFRKGFAIDSATGTLYLSDALSTNTAIYSISIASGTKTMIFNMQTFNSFLVYLAVSSNGRLFASDTSQHCIREILVSSTPPAVVTILAGSNVFGSSGSTDGDGTNALFSGPTSIAADSSGNLYVVDGGSSRIRKIIISIARVSTLAPTDSNGNPLSFMALQTISFGGSQQLFFKEEAPGVARSINVDTGRVTSYSTIQFQQSDGFITDLNGNLFVTDSPLCRIRKFVTSAQSPTASYVAGSSVCLDVGASGASVDGLGSSMSLAKTTSANPQQFTHDSSNGITYFIESSSSRIRMLQASKPCSAGKWCPSGSETGDTPCPAGYYCPFASDRVACPAGTYCTAGMSAVTQALPCSAGKYCPSASGSLDQGGPCPGGWYCAAGMDRALCNSGMYCPPGSALIDQGGQCAAGYYCAAGANRAICSSGKYCPPGSGTLDQGGLCAAGYFCAAGADRVICSAGKYCPPGSSTLDQGGPCTVGYYCVLGTDRAQCSPGKYCPSGSTNTDQPCTAGYYCAGGVDRAPCSIRKYCAPGQSIADLVDCTPGYACPGGGVSRVECIAGTYAAQGSSSCTQCPRGLVAALAGMFPLDTL